MPALLSRIVAWLRAGYPTGVPEQDYVALLGLLRRRLTDDEVRRSLASSPPRVRPPSTAPTSPCPSPR